MRAPGARALSRYGNGTMRHERTEDERLADNALLLTLWAEAQKRGPRETAGDRLKLMKLAFLAAYPLHLDGVKALNLAFYRYTHGPMASQVYDVWDDLIASRLLLEEEEFTVTAEGLRLAERFRN